MLTLEAPQFSIDGLTIFRDHADPRTFWWLPRSRVSVANRGRGLSFVTYSEDITGDPDFSRGTESSGGFLTLEVELGPAPGELDAIRDALEDEAGVSDPILAQVPFTDGSVTLYMLGAGSTGSGSGSAPTGFEVTAVGSSKPSLFGRQTAVFSARLGGKAAQVLYTTLRETADPQAVVVYDLTFRALEPAYNLEIEVDFKRTFEHMRHRVGVNLLIAQADLDFMIQESVNSGSIVIREIDFTDGSQGSPLSAEGGVLAIVRDLISPTLFNPLPVPTPDYRALPDSATAALSGGTQSFTSVARQLGSGGAGSPERTITVGEDIKITHEPVAGGQEAATSVDVSASIELAETVTDLAVKLHYRVQGEDAFTAVDMAARASGDDTASGGGGTDTASGGGGTDTASGGGGTDTAAGGGGTDTASGGGGTDTASGGGGTDTASGGGGTDTASGGGGTDVPTGDGGGGPEVPPNFGEQPVPPRRPDTPEAPESGEAASTLQGRIPGQAQGTTIEYYIEAKAKKGGQDIVQTVPASDATGSPFSYRVGTQADSRSQARTSGTELQTSTMIGYSLRSINQTDQIKRTFRLDKQKATTRSYHPGGALGADRIGPDFNPATQVTHVRLGEGPFKIIELVFRAGFDFAAARIRSATVHVSYGSGLVEQSIALSPTQTTGRIQFFADDAGTQHYTYSVEFVYEPDSLVGAVNPDTGLTSQTFANETRRDITIDLDRHSPVVPVGIRSGFLDFDSQVLRQVQVRVAPTAGGEGRTVKLLAGSDTATVNVVPVDAGRRYFMSQTFFFRDDSIELTFADATDTDVLVNEPDGVVYRMKPRFIDPYNLVDRILANASYTHASGERERATLDLTAENPSSEFVILRSAGDGDQWSVFYNYVMKSGAPLTSPTLTMSVPEPFADISSAGFRVVKVDLLDTALFDARDLLAVRIVLGGNLADPSTPTATVVLRAGTLTGSAVVPDVARNAPVQARIDVIRRGTPPETSEMALGPTEDTLFLFF